jgi:hypothetical protein
VTFCLAELVGQVVGHLYRPQPLAVTREEVAASDRFVLVFGNSRTEAGLDLHRLTRALSADGVTVRARAFSGGGWDSVHFYQLALLNRDLLRGPRDAVIIEVSPLSANDADSSNRLNVIRADAAVQVAMLPGTPVETRLAVLVGGLNPLYRYRLSIHSVIIRPVLDRAAGVLARWLKAVGIVGLPRTRPAFEIVTVPGRDFLVAEVRGDRAAFRAASRIAKRDAIEGVSYGGFKLAALRRAVSSLRERGIRVYLVETPGSTWFTGELRRSAVWRRYRVAMSVLAHETGATFLADWPASLSDDDKFWDDEHMVVSAAEEFTDALAGVLKR